MRNAYPTQRFRVSLLPKMISSYTESPHRCRIALPGGPGGGKTTAADLFRREVGEQVVIVPEAATLVFSGGFPRCSKPESICASQHAIYHVQENLEDVQSAN
jgi:ADP-ribose pyrophosphatase YjhB (NUDIX family)